MFAQHADMTVRNGLDAVRRAASGTLSQNSV